MSPSGPSGTSYVPQPKLPKDAKLQLRISGRAKPIPLSDVGQTTIGSAPDNTIVISNDPGVSSRHLMLSRTGLGLAVQDLNSTNGTWVVLPGQRDGGSRIKEMVWYPELPLRISETELMLEIARPDDAPTDFEGLVGRTPAMLAMYDLIDRLGPTKMPVLVLGPIGAGKELVVNAIHRRSTRRERPLEIFNSAGMDGPTVNSELFGHSKGAFTGADADAEGVFTRCDKATLAFDELGTMPIEVQAKLLRALQEGEVRRVGDNRLRKVDVRVIASTNANLHALIGVGKFRQDLYSRLNTGIIRVPPLMDRLDDLPLLVKKALHHHKAPDVELTDGAMNKLMGHDWPTNVRELFGVIERGLALARRRSPLTPEHINLDVIERPEHARHPEANDPKWLHLVGMTEAQIIAAARRKAVERSNGVQAEAARELDIHPSTLKAYGSKNRSSG